MWLSNKFCNHIIVFLFRILYSYPEVKRVSQILYHYWTIPLKIPFFYVFMFFFFPLKVCCSDSIPADQPACASGLFSEHRVSPDEQWKGLHDEPRRSIHDAWRDGLYRGILKRVSSTFVCLFVSACLFVYKYYLLKATTQFWWIQQIFSWSSESAWNHQKTPSDLPTIVWNDIL